MRLNDELPIIIVVVYVLLLSINISFPSAQVTMSCHKYIKIYHKYKNFPHF